MDKFSAGLIFTIIISVAPIADLSANDGKAIHNRDCTGCHDTEVYTRPDRSVKNLDKLRNRVLQCTYAVETRWSRKELSAVVDYLNTNFYKF